MSKAVLCDLIIKKNTDKRTDMSLYVLFWGVLPQSCLLPAAFSNLWILFGLKEDICLMIVWCIIASGSLACGKAAHVSQRRLGHMICCVSIVTNTRFVSGLCTCSVGL